MANGFYWVCMKNSFKWTVVQELDGKWFLPGIAEPVSPGMFLGGTGEALQPPGLKKPAEQTDTFVPTETYNPPKDERYDGFSPDPVDEEARKYVNQWFDAPLEQVTKLRDDQVCVIKGSPVKAESIKGTLSREVEDNALHGLQQEKDEDEKPISVSVWYPDR